MLFFLLSCLGSQKDSPPKTAQNIVTEDPIAENSKPSKQETAIEKPSLKKIVVSHKLPEELKLQLAVGFNLIAGFALICV